MWWISACRCSMACRSWWTRACFGRCGASGRLRRGTRCWTIREFAAGRLDAMPEAEQARDAHAAAFLALAEAGGRPHAGLAKKEWLERIAIEHNNIPAALAWYPQRDPPAPLRPAGSVAAVSL